MQFGLIGVVLNRLDEGVNGLVLLLVEQEIQASEVGLGRPAVFEAQLAQIEARRHPPQYKCDRQAQQQPAYVKFHVVGRTRRVCPARL